jgi:predicted nuclease of restriction endonuclease-like (RecB) superfamily
MRPVGNSKDLRMSKAPRKKGNREPAKEKQTPDASRDEFEAVLSLIDAARTRAVVAVNKTLIELYWSIGEYITKKVASEGWGKGTVEQLALTIQRRFPGVSGYSSQNLWRMRQFFETYRDKPKLSPLVRELSWTHNQLIVGKCKRDEEREFYLRLSQSESWTSRELERQINSALFERTILQPAKLSAPLRELHPDAAVVFKDSYFLEFLDLPREHSEDDLQRGLVEKLK